MIRGNERKDIFLDAEDKDRFLQTLYFKKQNDAFLLLAYCFMDNHVHLLIKEEMEEIARIMQKINVSYVHYFNKKYKRVGHLFQDRFRSEVVGSDSYLLSLARYIHRNPLKAGIVNDIREYPWSSYHAYVNQEVPRHPIVDKEIILELFDQQPQKAKKLFVEFMNFESSESYLDLDEKDSLDENEAKKLFLEILGNRQIKSEDTVPRTVLREIIIQFKEQSGLSIRKIAEIAEIDKSKVNRFLKD